MSEAVSGIGWVLPYALFAFVATAGLLWLLPALPVLRREQDRSDHGRIQRGPLFRRLAGFALVVPFWLAVWWSNQIVITPGIQALFLASLVVLVVGLWDDLSPVNWFPQLVTQVIVILVLVVVGQLSIDLMRGPGGTTWDFRAWFPGMPTLVFVLWTFLVLNAMNWLDGLDGLLGSVSLIGFLSLFAVSLLPEVRQPAIAFFTLVLSGSGLAFLVFNWPPARILAGTTGAYFLGLMLATLAVLAGAKVATALLVLTIPVLDALFVLWERWRARSPLVHPDRRHLHYRLLELGWSPRSILFLYTGATLFMASLALLTETLGKLLAFGGVTIVFLGACLYVRGLIEGRQRSL